MADEYPDEYTDPVWLGMKRTIRGDFAGGFIDQPVIFEEEDVD